MGKDKEIDLFKHLQDPDFRDEPCRVILPERNDRLSLLHRSDPGDWRGVAQIISSSFRFRTAWFPDANVAILDEAAPVWDALRLAGLGSSDASALFTGVMRHELEEWLERPRHHESRALAIRTALSSGTWARGFALEDDSPILPAVFGYMRLLGARRYVARPCPDGLTMFGTDPEKKCDTMNAIAKAVGRRALGLAKKGRIDAENSREVNLNDELHCLVAICHSLLTGRESVVLTADQDFIEIFWKAQWFFDTHYRAYLAAKLVKDGRFGKPVSVLENTNGHFDGPLTLYRRPTPHLREVLPRFYTSVPVSVVYVAPRNMIYKVGFQFEREMLDMLDMRSRTSGRCTDLFGEENIHVDLGPLKVGLEGLYLGIGRDAGRWAQTNETKTYLSRLDLEHALNCRERITRYPVAFTRPEWR
jgi:hypothetical protein